MRVARVWSLPSEPLAVECIKYSHTPGWGKIIEGARCFFLEFLWGGGEGAELRCLEIPDEESLGILEGQAVLSEN